MSRPRKQTVDYFPHMCSHGKTMFILEQRYGNDGFAFWFKLLESLGSTEGHYIDCQDVAAWSFLCAKSRIDEVTARGMLDLLAGLAAIDPEAWANQIIWSQNFVSGLDPVYRFRKCEIPNRPDLTRGKPTQADQSNGGNPQSKVEKSKEKNSKEEEEGDEKKTTAPAAKPPKPSSKFIPPSLEEVKEYCEERRNGIDPNAFMDHYLACGWVIGKKKAPMKDWRATIRTWEAENKKKKKEGFFD